MQNRYFASVATAAFVFAFSAASPGGATTVTVDFEGVNVTTAGGPVSGPALDSYLAGFGISLANVSGTVHVNSDVNDPDAPLTDQTSLASSGVNFLEEVGGQFVSYDLTFSQALDSFSFTRVAYYGATGSGLVYPAWTAEAFNSVGNSLGVLANVGVSGTFNSIGNPVPAQTYSISATGQIAYVRMTGNHSGFAGRNIAAIDDLVLDYTAAVPEPATLALFGLGLAGLMRLRGKRQA